MDYHIDKLGDILQLRVLAKGVYASLLKPSAIRAFGRDIAPGRESAAGSAYANLALHAKIQIRGDPRCSELSPRVKTDIAEQAADTFMNDKTKRTFRKVVNAKIEAHLSNQ